MERKTTKQINRINNEKGKIEKNRLNGKARKQRVKVKTCPAGTKTGWAPKATQGMDVQGKSNPAREENIYLNCNYNNKALTQVKLERAIYNKLSDYKYELMNRTS